MYVTACEKCDSCGEQNSHDRGSLTNSHPRLTLTPVSKYGAGDGSSRFFLS